MLVAQAAKAAEFFTGKEFGYDDIDRVYKKVNFSMRSIVLVGMPGCGKSTIGKSLAEKLGREFYDCDEYITETTGKTPAEWITGDGEARFRCIETEALAELTRRSASVISTGGGSVTVESNRGLLRQNGPVVFIDRPISQLTDKNRPLSRGAGAIEALWKAREPLYREICDITVKNGSDSAASDVSDKIIGMLNA